MIVAFHFQFANQAGWKCDVCRKSGLEQKRRCGWLGLGAQAGSPPVWARKHVVLGTCPKSYITPESATLLEDFAVFRRFGQTEPGTLTARQAEAFIILEHELAMEIKDGEQRTRHVF